MAKPYSIPAWLTKLPADVRASIDAEIDAGRKPSELAEQLQLSPRHVSTLRVYARNRRGYPLKTVKHAEANAPIRPEFVKAATDLRDAILDGEEGFDRKLKGLVTLIMDRAANGDDALYAQNMSVVTCLKARNDARQQELHAYKLKAAHTKSQLLELHLLAEKLKSAASGETSLESLQTKITEFTAQMIAKADMAETGT